VVDGDPCRRRRRRGEQRLPASLASNSSCKPVLLDEGMMAVPRVRSNGDGTGWWWLATVNTVQVEESRAEAVVRERERRRKWIRSSPRGVHALDKDEVRRFSEGGAPGLAALARWWWLRSGWRRWGESQGAGWLPTGPGPLKYF
jgi:hypothetical protein